MRATSAAINRRGSSADSATKNRFGVPGTTRKRPASSASRLIAATSTSLIIAAPPITPVTPELR